MKVIERFGKGVPVFSLEFFPPKTPTERANLIRTIDELKGFEPDFVSVTYPLDRSRRQQTLDLVAKIQRDYGITAVAHLTCVGSTVAEIGVTLDELASLGIGNILALRGDNPENLPIGDFAYASDLVRFVSREFSFCVGGAAHPETHPEARSFDDDILHLKIKVDSGCQFLITQLFFDNRHYYRLIEEATKIGIKIPIIPGIMPVGNVAGIKRILALNNSEIPVDFLANLEEVASDREAVEKLGIEFAYKQIRELLAEGAPGVHIYTLNRATSAQRLLTALREQKPIA